MDKVRLCLFGSPTLEHRGELLALPLERRTQLVVLLALRRGWVARAEIAAVLWPEQQSKLAFANLRKAVFRLQSLPWAAALETQAAALRFEAATDVADFEAALGEQRLADALEAYRGELLAGFDDGQSEPWTRWLGFERERLRAAWRGAALARLAADIEAAEAIALSARLLDADPLDEAALGAHMAALARDGQAGAARAAYRAFALHLAQDLGLEPGPELRALHDTLATPAGPKRVARVPAPDSGFVGRSIELQRIAALLARDECRLLCLIGPGGVGKTRLAARALRELAALYADGALFVPLEDAATPARFAALLAREAGVARAGADALAAVIDALRERELLLVLDNFEQLAAHAGLLERLLEACPRLKILLTSRVRLAVAGEWSIPLEGLPCPDPEDEDRAEAFDAVRLFIQAALRIEPGLVPAAEMAAIIEICRLVEGLPLALELAAAWVRVLPCTAIATELRQGSELLRTLDASRPARHASIELVFEHSWQHLAPAERDALARLSVFRGGFSAEAARAVAGAALPVLGALVDKSLLAKDSARLHLHPLVQQLAALRLAQQGQGEAQTAAQAAHAAWFQRWLEQHRPGSEDGRREALQAIDTEFENCSAAWQFGVAAGQAEALMRSLPTLVNYFEHRARFDEGLALLRQALDAPLGASHARFHARLLSLAALLEWRLGRYGQAQAHASQALAAPSARRDYDTRYQALSVLAGSALVTGDSTEAQRQYQRALALAREHAQMHDLACALDNLALGEKYLGHYDEALRLTIEALAQHRRNGNDARAAVCLSNLGSLYLVIHEDAAAEAQLKEALQLSERHGLVSTRAYVLSNLTELATKAGDWDAARTHAEQALEIAAPIGLRALAGWLKAQLARAAARRAELALARELLAGAAALALTLGTKTVKAAVLLGLAEVLEAQDHKALARRVLAFAADEASLTAPDRDELRAAWARRASPPDADPAWPDIGLDELLRRVGVEREAAFAPLIAALQGPG